MELLIELIPTLGFPIVCCVAVGLCFYQMLNKVLSTKIAELGQIIDKNTENIAIMNERLEKLNEEIKEVKGDKQ